MTGNEKGGTRSAVNSRLENLRNLSPAARRDRVGDVVSLTDAERNVFAGGGLPIALANGMIENVIGTFELPIGVATNFTINGRDYLIPMAVEEPRWWPQPPTWPACPQERWLRHLQHRADHAGPGAGA